MQILRQKSETEHQRQEIIQAPKVALKKILNFQGRNLSMSEKWSWKMN